MNKNKVFVVALGIVAVSFFGGLAYFNRQAKVEEAQRAPVIDASVLVRPHSPIKGQVDAPVTVVEFLDPECESCAAMHPVVSTLLDEFSGKIRVVIRYIPFHPNSAYASAALEETRETGKYVQALDMFYSRQPEWASHENPRPELIAKYLQELGVKKEHTSEEYLVPKHKEKLALDLQDAKSLGIQQTPTFFVEGRRVENIGYRPLKVAIENALKSR